MVPPKEPDDSERANPNEPVSAVCDCEQIICLLDKIARITCLTANEVHRNGTALKSIDASLQALVEMYRTANPAAALDYDRQVKQRAQLDKCCPPEEHEEHVCKYVPCPPGGGARRGD